jgi:hypothetical protein
VLPEVLDQRYAHTVTVPPCATCSARDRLTEVRDNFMGPVDTTLGLTPIGNELYACPECGLRYRRTLDLATRFHDYDQYLFSKLDGPAGTKRVFVIRCPQCGSTSAGADESKSAYDFTYMQCQSCDHGGLVDSWERDFDWKVEIEVPADAPYVPSRLPPLAPGEGLYESMRAPAFGCARCAGEDAAAAWEATQSKRGPSLVQESHFSIRLTECSCGQAFVVVFTERIDFHNGEDDQDWLVLPVTPAERSKLAAASEAELPRLVTELGRERRFLVRSFPTGGSISAGWRIGGFAIGPHD